MKGLKEIMKGLPDEKYSNDLEENEVREAAEPAEPVEPVELAEPAEPFRPACYVWPPSQQPNSDNSYDGGSKRRHRVKSINKRSKRRGKPTKKRSKKRVNKSRKRQRRHK